MTAGPKPCPSQFTNTPRISSPAQVAIQKGCNFPIDLAGFRRIRSPDVVSVRHPLEYVKISLDTRGGRVLSRCDALRDASPTEAAGRVATLGVSTLIALELQRVGTGSGPDLAILRDVRTAAPGAALIAGGGVRGLNDLSALDDLGCAGALVGTAITTGALTPEALDTWRAARA